jgi:hypothetical protein
MGRPGGRLANALGERRQLFPLDHAGNRRRSEGVRDVERGGSVAHGGHPAVDDETISAPAAREGLNNAVLAA